MKGGNMKKRGLSAIVTTLIIILLVLVAVSGIWVVVSNFLDAGGETIELSTKCLAVVLNVKSAECTDDAGTDWHCDVTYERKAGGDDIAGVKIVLTNGETSHTNVTHHQNVAALDIRTAVGIDTEIPKGNDRPNSVQLAAYFEDASGNEQLCNPTSAFTF